VTPTLESLADTLTTRLAGLARVERNAPIAALTTYRLGGPAAVLVRIDSQAAATALAAVVREHRPAVLVVGRGSNLLVADRGFDGVAVVLDGDLAAIDVAPVEGDAGAALVHAGGGVVLPSLARATAAQGWGGHEFFVGIPGSVGGAVCMNAGGHGRETVDVLVDADILALLDGGPPQRRTAADLDLGYRRSNVAAHDLVLGARFRVAAARAAECRAAIAAIVGWRREHQPGGSNAGSVFRNPPGDSAGRLIDSLALKGLRVGGAAVSAKHANFFQAGPGATADDVYALVREVRRRVRDATGVDLVPELRTVGFDRADGGSGP
jgi:UDP-N-acetylmuramate dehydrogenase